MTAIPDRRPDSDRFRYSVRTLLAVVTATCILLGVLQWVLPNETSIGFRIGFAVMIAALVAYAVHIVNHGKRHPWKTPEDFVIVKVDAKWKRRVKSPFIMGPIAAFTGVSLSFAPFFLFWCGQAEEFGVFEWIAVPSSFLIIYLVPGFYMSLASEVIAELLKPDCQPEWTAYPMPKQRQERHRAVDGLSDHGPTLGKSSSDRALRAKASRAQSLASRGSQADDERVHERPCPRLGIRPRRVVNRV